MKQIYILLIVLITTCCWACSEDSLTPSEPYRPYAPDASATDEEAQLRRDFYEANEVFILFNDTLSVEQAGTDSEGQPVYTVSKIDPAYSLFGYADATYEFTYQKTLAAKQASAAFVADMVDKMVFHKFAKPHAVLVVDEISVDTELSSGKIQRIQLKYLNSLTCFIIALPDGAGTSKDAYDFITNINASDFAKEYASDLEDFYAVSKTSTNRSIYGRWKDSELGKEYGFGLGEEYIEKFYERGLLVNTDYEKFCTKEEDVASYLSLLLRMNKAEVQKTFARYPLVLQKYEAICEVAAKSDINFKH